MSEQPNTESITLDGKEYVIKTRLGWQEQSRISQSAVRIFIDGHQVDVLSNGKGFDDIDVIEIRPDPTMQNTMRLQCRLVNVTPRLVPMIPPRHVKALIARIEELEKEEAEEEAALAPDAPLERRLKDSATTPSSWASRADPTS
jgi:hypothetical protein